MYQHSTFLERKLTGGYKILFNLGNKFHKFYISMINGAINAFPRMCVFVGVGSGGLLKTFTDHENLMDIECHGQIDNENIVHFYIYFLYFINFLAYQKQQDFELLFRC